MKKTFRTWYEYYWDENPIAPESRRDAIRKLLNVAMNHIDVLDLTSRWTDAIKLLQTLMTIARQNDARDVLAIQTRLMGEIYLHQSKFDIAITWLKQAIELLDEMDNQMGVIYCKGKMGDIHSMRGDFDLAKQHYEEALTQADVIGDINSKKVLLGNMAAMYGHTGKYDQARECYQILRDFFDASGDMFRKGIMLSNLGNIYLAIGKNEEARECYQTYYETIRKMGDKRRECLALGNLGALNKNREDFEQATSYFNKQLKLGNELGEKFIIGFAKGSLGEIYHLRGDWDHAIVHLEAAVHIYRMLKAKVYLAHFLYHLAQARYDRKEYHLAAQANDESNQLLASIKNPELIFNTSLLRNRILAHTDRDTAIERIKAMLSDLNSREQHEAIYEALYQIMKNDPGLSAEAQYYYNETLRLLNDLWNANQLPSYRSKIEQLRNQF